MIATRVGNHLMVKTDEGFVLTGPQGEYVGTYPTARAAMDAGVARIKSTLKARGIV